MARGEHFFLLITIGLLASYVVDGLGVNWGQISTQKLPPKVVVQMLKANNISKVKLFDIDDATMQGLAGSDIEVMVAIPNLLLNSMTNPKTASLWVEKNVTKYLNQKPPVNIKYVAVGNEPFLINYSDLYLNSTYPALKNVQTALNDAGHGDKVKATVPLNADVYTSSSDHFVPSAGYFRPDISTQMSDIAKFLDKNKAPFTVNIYPYINIYQDPSFPFDYAFFDGVKTPIMDDDIKYDNSFDAAYDTLAVALEKVGVKNIPIFIGEVGWPTDGEKRANVQLAEKFYRGLMKKLGNNMGTPLRPKQYIEVYLFGLLDEDAKSVLPGNFERHWGLFTQDGQPKFPIDFTGKGRNITLVGAKDVKMLPKKWCVLRSDAKNKTLIEETIKYACDYGDCTPLGTGCSCGELDAAGSASFAYNVYYQNMGQKAGSCSFSGLAMETTKDPSSGNCTFPIRVAPPPTPSPPPASAPESGPPADDKDKDKAKSPSSSAYYYGPSLLLLLGLEVVASFFF